MRMLFLSRRKANAAVPLLAALLVAAPCVGAEQGAVSKAGDERTALAQVRAGLTAQREKIRALSVEYRYEIIPLVKDAKLLSRWGMRQYLETADGLEAVKGLQRYFRYDLKQPVDMERKPIASMLPHVDVTVIDGVSMTRSTNGVVGLRDVDYGQLSGLHYLVNVGLFDPGPPGKGGDQGLRLLLLPEVFAVREYRRRDATERVDGSECLVLENPADVLWLDLKHGLALRQREFFEGGRLSSRTINKDLREVAPGVWLPFESHELYFAPRNAPQEFLGQPVVDERVVVKRLSINDPQIDRLFKIDPKDAVEDLRSGKRR